MKKSTKELLDVLKNTKSIDDYLSNELSSPTDVELTQLLEAALVNHNISKADAIKASGLARTYAYQIFQGIKQPSRDKLLCLCIGIKMDVEEVQSMLRICDYPPLYAKKERDSVILFALMKKLSITDTNELLYAQNMELQNDIF